MAKYKKPAKARRTPSASNELDSIFFLKLVLYLILGSLWLKVSHGSSLNLPIPVGLIAGVFFTAHEHFQIDRKIEYAILLVAMLIGFFAPFGLYLHY